MLTIFVLAHWLYAKECCEEAHCMPVPCDQIVDSYEGWRWRNRYFSRAMLRPSQMARVMSA